MKAYENEAWLWEAYVDEEKSLRQVADELGCGRTTILRKLKSFGIPVRSKGESRSREPQKAARRTQTLREAFDKRIALDKLVAELEETQELIKALKGEESDYYVSPADIEANKKAAYEKQRAEREKKLREDEEFEKRRRGDTGAWHAGDWREQLEDIMYKLGERL